jgi:hypothetical protein
LRWTRLINQIRLPSLEKRDRWGCLGLSQFTQSALERIKEKVADSIGIGRLEYPKWEVPYDLAGKVGRFTSKAVEEVIAELNGGGEDGERAAQKLIAVFPAENLLEADKVLDSLDLVGTPGQGLERLTTITDLLDLNYSLQRKYDFKDSLIGIMSDYWNQIPVFYEDLSPVFKTMKRMYKDHPKTARVYMNWTSSYTLRDGILEVTEELLKTYGIKYDGFTNEKGFGIKSQRTRYILPGVSGEEYMETICRVNLDIADAEVWPYHLMGEDVREPEEENSIRYPGWKEALFAARDRKLAEFNKDPAARHDNNIISEEPDDGNPLFGIGYN